jgi:beta-galactosidase
MWSSCGNSSASNLSVDRNTIKADRRDVAHIVVKIVDDGGRIVPNADDEIDFDVAGEGRLIGVDSGNPFSHESYKSNRRKAFHGLCLAIVQSNAAPGQILVTAKSPSLQSKAVTINTLDNMLRE